MISCLVILGVANIVGALATSFPLLFVSRILAGVGAGGVFPVSLGLTSALVGSEKRQIGISRTLAGSMTGNLLGASFSGLIGDLLGWRGVLVILGALVVVAAIAVAAGFRGEALKHPPRASLGKLRHGYRTIFTNPNARVCFSAVFVEGCCVLGLFPFIASFLFDLGETSLSVAGIVIAGFAIGGLFYTATVSRFLPVIGMRGMMIAGATLVGLQLIATAFGPAWKLQFLCMLMMGWGFYMIHGCLQVFASELSVEARATALSLHSFFFSMGQTVGPIVYGFGLQHAGKMTTLVTAAACMITVGTVCAGLLRQRAPADAAARPDVEPARDADWYETSSRSRFLFAHDLFGKPRHALPDHALADARVTGCRAIVAPELPVAGLDALRVDRDVSGQRARDPNRKFGSQLLQIRGHSGKSLRDGNIAVVIGGDPVVETDGFEDGAARTRRRAVAELGDDRNAHIERFPGRDTAVLRKRIERDIDGLKRPQMVTALARAHTNNPVLRNALDHEASDESIAQKSVVEGEVLHHDLRSRHGAQQL